MDTSDNEEHKFDWHDIATSAGLNIPEQEPVEDTGEYDEVEETPSADVQEETNVFGESSGGSYLPPARPVVISAILTIVASLALFMAPLALTGSSNSASTSMDAALLIIQSIVVFAIGGVITAIVAVTTRKNRKGKLRKSSKAGNVVVCIVIIIALLIIAAIIYEYILAKNLSKSAPTLPY